VLQVLGKKNFISAKVATAVYLVLLNSCSIVGNSKVEKCSCFFIEAPVTQIKGLSVQVSRVEFISCRLGSHCFQKVGNLCDHRSGETDDDSDAAGYDEPLRSRSGSRQRRCA